MPPRRRTIGRSSTKVAPPPGVSSHRTAPWFASTERAHDREAEAGSLPVGGRVEADELVEDPLAVGGRDAGPVVDRRAARTVARHPPRTSIAPPDGSWTATFSSRFAEHVFHDKRVDAHVRQLGIEVER